MHCYCNRVILNIVTEINFNHNLLMHQEVKKKCFPDIFLKKRLMFSVAFGSFGCIEQRTVLF